MFLWPNLSSKHTDLKKVSMQPRHYWALWQKHIKKPEWNKASLILIEKRKQSHSFSSWYSITQNMAFTEYFTFSRLSITQLVVVLVHCQVWCWLKIPIPTQFPSSSSYGIFVFFRGPWCQPPIEFIPSSRGVKDLTWMRQENGVNFYFHTSCFSRNDGFAGGKDILSTPNFEFFKRTSEGFGLSIVTSSISLKRDVRLNSLQSPEKPYQHCQKEVGKRAASLTINSAETEKYLQLLPLLKKTKAEFCSHWGQ